MFPEILGIFLGCKLYDKLHDKKEQEYNFDEREFRNIYKCFSNDKSMMLRYIRLLKKYNQ